MATRKTWRQVGVWRVGYYLGYYHYPFFFVRNDSTTLDHPQIYGQPEPLPWLLEEVNVPVSLYWGQNDWLSAIEDYTRMQDEVRFTKIGIHVMAK